MSEKEVNENKEESKGKPKEEIKSKKNKNKTNDLAPKFDVEKYYVVEKHTIRDKVKVKLKNADLSDVYEDKYIKREVELTVPIEGFRSHRMKCKLNTCKVFDVDLEHLTEAYSILNGKKVDGFYSTDLIDRHGFSDGRLKNRADLAKEYNHMQIRTVDIATENLKKIIQKKDVKKAYLKYIEGIKIKKEKEIDENALFGE